MRHRFNDSDYGGGGVSAKKKKKRPFVYNNVLLLFNGFNVCENKKKKMTDHIYSIIIILIRNKNNTKFVIYLYQPEWILYDLSSVCPSSKHVGTLTIYAGIRERT